MTGYSRPVSNEPAPPDRLRLWPVPAVLAAVAIAALIAIELLPAVGGVSRKALEHSIEAKLSKDARECFPLPRARSFTCEHSSSDPWLYRIRIDGKCWTATRLQGYTYPRHLHSCAGLRDQIRLWSWLDY